MVVVVMAHSPLALNCPTTVAHQTILRRIAPRSLGESFLLDNFLHERHAPVWTALVETLVRQEHPRSRKYVCFARGVGFARYRVSASSTASEGVTRGRVSWRGVDVVESVYEGGGITEPNVSHMVRRARVHPVSLLPARTTSLSFAAGLSRYRWSAFYTSTSSCTSQRPGPPCMPSC